MRIFRYRDTGGQSHELHWQREGDRLSGAGLEVELEAEQVTHEGRRLPYRVVREGAHTWVWLAGELFRFEVESGAARRRGGDAGQAGGDQIVSEMPGKILELKAGPGDEVESGQVLVVMESMKMELTLTAPRDGVVKEVPVQVEQMVDLGILLVQLEPGAGAGRPAHSVGRREEERPTVGPA